MEFANQYGINLPAIDQAISAKKTAEQNMKMNDMKMNALTKEQERQDQLESADTNIKNELYPKSKAVTLQQAREEEAITNAQKEYKLKQNLVAHQQVATHIADLINQPDAIKIPTVQNNLRQLQQTNPEQFAFSMSKLPKIGSGDINDPEYIKQIIPYMAKDVFDDATKAQHAYEEHKAQQKHEYDLDTEKVKGENQYALETSKEKSRREDRQLQNEFLAGQYEANRNNATRNAMISHSDRGAPTASSSVAAESLAFRKQQAAKAEEAKAREQSHKQWTERYKRAEDLVPSELTDKTDIENWKRSYATYGEMPKKEGNTYKTGARGNTKKSETVPNPMNNVSKSTTSADRPTKAQVIQMAQQKGKDPQAALKAFGY